MEKQEQAPEVLERVPEAVEEIKAYLEKEQVEEAASMLKTLHPADQAAVFVITIIGNARRVPLILCW